MSVNRYNATTDTMEHIAGNEAIILDEVPTEGSNNAVKSGGVFAELANKANLTQITNPNLLDNPWFTVNQRGQSTYSVTGTTEIYTVDRWSMLGWSGKTVSFNVDSSGITFSAGVNSFRQKLYDIWDALVGKKLTLSIEYTSTTASGQVGIVKGGSWDTNTVINFKTGHNVDSVTFTAESGTNPIFWVYIPETNTDFNIKAVKLELGSVSTLAMDTAPNYATELLKCQRYFQRIKIKTNYAMLGLARAVSATSAQSFITPTVPLRTYPSLTVGNISSLSFFANSTSYSINNIVMGTCSYNDSDVVGIQLQFTSSGLTTDDLLSFAGNNQVATNAPYLDLSADL